jgi:hypothetical protein
MRGVRDATNPETLFAGGYGQELYSGNMITLDRQRGALCLVCADLDHLEFLPSGDAAVTRRASKYSGLKAVVLQWSRTRQRYERQGIRHRFTNYDDLLQRGVDRGEARALVAEVVAETLQRWSGD